LAIASIAFGGSVGAAPTVPKAVPKAVTGVGGVRGAPFVLRHGETAPVYSYADAIRESVWVNAPDGDGDGHLDVVTADIVRPSELDGVTTVPAIIDPSPYYLCCGRGNEHETKTYDADGNPLKLPLFYDNYFEPRGYAVVEVDMAGTARSSGCADEGAASDINSIKAVIDWLNGRTTAADVDGNAVTASWANGSVGLIGKSYDGTLALGVAATGVSGLKTFVPISAISSWYDYDRSQGLPFSYNYPSGLSQTVEFGRTRSVDCSAINARMDQNDADDTGAYTTFWSKRDYRDAPPPAASKVTASMFLIHGLQDTNVKTVNFGRWLARLRKSHLVTKVWLSRLGHVDPFDFRRALWVDTLHRWFDNQLMGIDNGILDEPRVDVETSPDMWVTSNSWPVYNNRQVLTFHADGSLTTEAAESGTASFVNSPTQSEARATAQGTNPNRLLYLTDPLAHDVRISGEPTVRLKITPQGSTGQVGVALVDYGSQVRVRDDGDGSKTLGTQSCWGDSTSYDDACYFDVDEDQVQTSLAVLARGWARLTGGQSNTLTVDLAYDDVLIPAGHQLGVAVFGASFEWIVTVDGLATPYDLDLGSSSLTLPIVGPFDVSVGGGAAPSGPSAPAASHEAPSARIPV
jgi:X-Pro dipeptidyl-peptidase